MRTTVLATAGILVLLCATIASAQLADISRVKVPFPFVAGKTTLPAGEYSFLRTPEDLAVRIIGQGKAPAAALTVITRLAGEMHTTPNDAHVVFDKVGDTYFLSELWFPGVDGFLLHETKEKHEHRTLNAPVLQKS